MRSAILCNIHKMGHVHINSHYRNTEKLSPRLCSAATQGASPASSESLFFEPLSFPDFALKVQQWVHRYIIKNSLNQK